MKRKLIIVWLLASIASLQAGDLAVLENLGFDSGGRYFMFGQHVLIPDLGQAYAEIGIVNIAQNNFVPGGWKKRSWNVPILPNQNSRGALYELLTESVDLKNRYGIDHLRQGRLLYVRSNGDDTMVEGMDGENLNTGLVFRDFERGREYTLILNQERSPGTDREAAGFSIDMSVKDASGAVQNYVVGRKSYMRPDVVSYEIVRVWTDVSGQSVVIGIAKTSADLSIRYMVETLRLR